MYLVDILLRVLLFCVLHVKGDTAALNTEAHALTVLKACEPGIQPMIKVQALVIYQFLQLLNNIKTTFDRGDFTLHCYTRVL